MSTKLNGGKAPVKTLQRPPADISQPGKTPPRLLEDLNLYNPNKLPTTAYNVLTDSPLPYKKDGPELRKTGKGACHHTWILKPHTSTASGAKTSDGSDPMVAALCMDCRCHLALRIDRKTEEDCMFRCGKDNIDNPLHHFVYVPAGTEGDRQTQTAHQESWEDSRTFRCSSGACALELRVQMYSPRLRRQWIDLLSDRAIIAKRAKDAMSADPERFEGHAVPSPITVMANLRAYIGNAMKGDKRTISAGTKKWLLSLGEPCSELLEYLRFSRSV